MIAYKMLSTNSYQENNHDENNSGAFDHEEYEFLEHGKQMNDLNRRMVDEFDRIFEKGDKSEI